MQSTWYLINMSEYGGREKTPRPQAIENVPCTIRHDEKRGKRLDYAQGKYATSVAAKLKQILSADDEGFVSSSTVYRKMKTILNNERKRWVTEGEMVHER